MIDAADSGSPSEDSHEQTPTPYHLDKGKMRQVDPITPSLLPAPSPSPIKLISLAVADAMARAAGKKKGKKAQASFVS